MQKESTYTEKKLNDWVKFKGTEKEFKWVRNQNVLTGNQCALFDKEIAKNIHLFALLVFNKSNTHIYEHLEFSTLSQLLHFLNLAVINRYRFKNNINEEKICDNSRELCFTEFLNSIINNKISIDNYFIKEHFLDLTTSDDWFMLVNSAIKFEKDIEKDQKKKDKLQNFFKSLTKKNGI